MTLSATLHSQDQLTEGLGEALGSPGNFAAVSRGLVAEFVRCATSFQFGISNDAIPAVPTARIKSYLRKNLLGLWAGRSVDQAENCFDTTLRDLEAVGDIFDLGSGHWVGTPLRLVGNEGSAPLMLAGGLPKFAALSVLHTPILCSGPARYVRVAPGRSEIQKFIQPFSTWFGQSEPLEIWTKRTLSYLVEQFSSTGDGTTEQLELYAPDVHQKRKTMGRWIRAQEAGALGTGVRLCRPVVKQSQLYDRPSYLAHIVISGGVPVLRSTAPVPFETSRRLRFGIDALLKTPRELNVVRLPQSVALRIPFSLPKPEAKIMGLSWTTKTDSVGDCYDFGRDAEPIIFEAMRRLMVTIKISEGGNHVGH